MVLKMQCGGLFVVYWECLNYLNFDFVLVQQMLYSEFVEHCRPSEVMTLQTFCGLMRKKGLASDRCPHLFR